MKRFIPLAIIIMLISLGCGSPEQTAAAGASPSSTTTATVSTAIATTNGGAVSITDTSTTILGSGETLEGFTADANGYYMMVSESGGGTWDFRLSTSLTTAFGTRCTLTPDGTFDTQSGLAYDGLSFYLIRTTPIFRKYSGTTCAIQANLNSGVAGNDISAPTAVTGGKLFWNQDPTNLSAATSYVAQTDTTSAATSKAFDNQTVGTQSTQFGAWTGNGNGSSGTVAIAAYGTTLYMIFMSNWKLYLWKMNTSGVVTGWALLPAATFPTNIYLFDYLGAPDANHLVVASQSSTTVKFVTLDVSLF